jgi:hypothetical protein
MWGSARRFDQCPSSGHHGQGEAVLAKTMTRVHLEFVERDNKVIDRVSPEAHTTR